MTEDKPDLPPVHPKHLAFDRFGKGALHAAHDITEALAEAGVDDDGAVVLRTDGPRHSFAQLEALIDEALAEEAEHREEPKAP
ncbi:hypothetical protein GCM10010464_51960 [Pseudonocardia yunnanensis]|jgi:hypothetical protein|uniref:Uncharacterized protein n=1 Tax=Pseudonocardia yunnanensis TaxID=58107 RepID=A0ABW4EPE9_9PSEU